MKSVELSEPNLAKFHACKKGWFLTYPQCDLTRADLGDHLLSLGPEIVVVAQEKHKSGDLHLHAWIEYAKPKNVKRCDFFDYKGFHCNIGSSSVFRIYFSALARVFAFFFFVEPILQ